MARMIELEDTKPSDYFKSDTLLAQALAGGMTKLQDHDKAFAQKMLDSIDQWSRFTDKQRVVVERLIDKAENGYPKNVELVGDLSGINALIDTALANGLKFPKVHLTVDGAPMVISRCGERSQTPGALNITDGGPFNENVWYGKVIRREMRGVYIPNGRLPRDVTSKVGHVLTALSNDPKGIMTGHGTLTGFCACCGHKLTAPKSVQRGVGPECAKRWGIG